MEKVKIKDLDCLISDGNYSSKYPRSNEFVSEGIPFIRCNNFKNNTIVKEDMYYITKEKHAILLKGHVKTGDVLITTRGSLGQVVRVPKEYDDANINAQIVLLRTNPQKINNRYLMWQLKSPEIQYQIMKNKTGTALQQLPIRKLENIEIIIENDIGEQIKIATELDKVQEIIDIRKKQIDQLDELIKSQFVEMFGDIKNDSFDIIPIRNLVDTNIVKTKKKYKANDVIKYIDISSIDNIKNEIIGYTEYDIGTEPSRAQQCLLKGDILISTVRPNLRNIAVNNYDDDNMVGSSGFCILRPKKCKLEYLLEAVKTNKFTNDMVAVTIGANYPAIHSTDILDYEISVPPMELQNKFAEFVKQIDKQKFEIQKSLEEIQKLQESLMNKYFGG